jgi:PleD family two-component response regulator
MRQERLRSERSGSPLSLVVIDSVRMLDFLMEKNSVSRRRFTKHIARVIKNSTRESDVKGRYEDGKIALLTLDTDESGARALAVNLNNRILASTTEYSHTTVETMPFMRMLCGSLSTSPHSTLAGVTSPTAMARKRN